MGKHGLRGKKHRNRQSFEHQYAPQVLKIRHFARYTLSKLQFVFRHSERFHNLTLIAAIFVAGWWTYLLFISERESQPHLGMDVQTTEQPTTDWNDRRLIFFDVVLKNQGKRKLEAAPMPTTEIAYNDPGETLKYPCSLQIRQILTSQIFTNKSLDFFNDTNVLSCPTGIPAEIDLLTEYELVD